MIRSTDLILADSRNKCRLGLSILLSESLLLLYFGYIIFINTGVVFSGLYLLSGLVGLIVVFKRYQSSKSFADSEPFKFFLIEKNDLLRWPSLYKCIKGAFLILLAFVFGHHIPYFGSSIFGMYGGGSVGSAIVAQQYPLLEAIDKGDIDKMYSLVKSGFPVNGKRFRNKKCIGTPIEKAAIKRTPQALFLLLSEGAVFEGCQKEFTYRMISSGPAENNLILLERGIIRANKKYNRQYPLSILAHRCLNLKKKNETTKKIEIYIENGANPNEGKALYIAANRNCVETAKILIENGADPLRTYEEGMTILDLLKKGEWARLSAGFRPEFDPAIVKLFEENS